MAPKKKYTCELCGEFFEKIIYLRRHNKDIHGENMKPFSGIKRISRYECGICEEKFSKLKEFEDHLPIFHNIELEMYKFVLSSVNEFNSWKEIVEEKESTFYIKTRYNVSNCKKNIVKYRCHWLGYLKRKICESVKETNFMDSFKINAFCPASITASFVADGTVKVEHCKTHVGHDTECCYFQIDCDEREEIENKFIEIPIYSNSDEMKCESVSSESQEKCILQEDVQYIVGETLLESNCGADSNLKIVTPLENEFVVNDTNNDSNFIVENDDYDVLTLPVAQTIEIGSSEIGGEFESSKIGLNLPVVTETFDEQDTSEKTKLINCKLEVTKKFESILNAAKYPEELQLIEKFVKNMSLLFGSGDKSSENFPGTCNKITGKRIGQQQSSKVPKKRKESGKLVEQNMVLSNDVSSSESRLSKTPMMELSANVIDSSESELISFPTETNVLEEDLLSVVQEELSKSSSMNVTSSVIQDQSVCSVVHPLIVEANTSFDVTKAISPVYSCNEDEQTFETSPIIEESIVFQVESCLDDNLHAIEVNDELQTELTNQNLFVTDLENIQAVTLGAASSTSRASSDNRGLTMQNLSDSIYLLIEEKIKPDSYSINFDSNMLSPL